MNKKVLYQAMMLLMVTHLTGCFDGNDDPVVETTVVKEPTAEPRRGHPYPQPIAGLSKQSISDDGITTTVITPEGQHPAQDPFAEPPGSNFLANVNSNLFDSAGNEMPNTQPSSLGEGNSQYLLHDGPVVTTDVSKTSPTDDLKSLTEKFMAGAAAGNITLADVQLGLDILEGNAINGKTYSGFPMLHYNGPNKIKVVEPILDDTGNVIGGNVVVNMIYFDQRIEADTAFIDPSAVQEVPWTITYNVSILTGGIEDFSPMTMHFDRNADGSRGPFHASMDQTFFPMLQEGKRYQIKIKESLGKYYNLTYTWGWRIHPPRIQVTENALKTTPDGTTLPQHEINVFGEDPKGSAENQLAAIAKIGDISPAKRMWNVLKNNGTNMSVANAEEFKAAFFDWSDRTKLPAGVTADPNATITLLYANNTIYGSRQGLTGKGSELGSASFKGICNGCVLDWKKRPFNYKVTLYNGDHFVHGYMNVDFGGSRGWENQFQETDPTTALAPNLHTEQTTIVGTQQTLVDDVLLDTTPNQGKAALAIDPVTGEVIVTNDKIFPMNTGGSEEFLQPSPRETDAAGENTFALNPTQQLGSGCFFTFGRNWAWPNAGGPMGAILVPPVADDGTLGLHKVDITYNFEPSRRLKIYQFDPLHHDVAVYSLH